MSHRRTAVLVALSLAYAGGLGFGEDSAAPAPKSATPRPVEEPRLKEILHDDFQTDTRTNYEIKGDVVWEKGRLTLPEKSSIGAKLESGPWAEWRFYLDPSALEKDGDQASMLLRLKLEGASDACVNWICTRHTDQKTTGLVQILDTSIKNGESTFILMREFSIPDIAGSWKVGYRNGLVYLSKGDHPLGMGYIENENAFPNHWSLSADKRKGLVHVLSVTASPMPPLLTADEIKTLTEALALHNSAVELYRQGKSDQAEPLFAKALALREQVLGDMHTACASSLNNLALVHESLGSHAKAESLLLRARDINKHVLGEEHPLYATILNSLALLYGSTGQLMKAEHFHLQSQDILKRVLGENHPTHALSLNNLAKFYESMGAYAKAEPLFLQSHDLQKRLLGETHPHYVTCLFNLGMLYNSMGDYSKAEGFLIRSVDIRKRILGESHPDYATGLAGLATVYLSKGDYAKAEPLFLLARDTRGKVLGIDHPDYASSLNDLGFLYSSMGAFDRAEALYLESRDIRKRVLGEAHPRYATSLNNLGSFYVSTHEYDKAEQLLIEALRIRRMTLGTRHPDYAGSLHNLGSLYKSLGVFAKAEPLYFEACEIFKSGSGENDLRYATSLSSLGMLYFSMGEYSKSETLVAQARDVRRRRLGEEHPDYATSLNDLATIYAFLQAHAKAEPLYVQALDIRRRVLGVKHPDYAASLNNLAELYASMGEREKAEPLLAQAVALFPREHPDYATRLSNLAGIYRSSRENAKAERLYLEALDLKKRSLGEQHLSYASTLHGLGILYDLMGQTAKAEEHYLRTLDIRKRVLGEDHPDYLISLGNLASLYSSMREFERAEPLNQRALDATVRNAQTLIRGLSEARAQELAGESAFALSSLLSAARRIQDYPSQRAYASVWQAHGMTARMMREHRRVVKDDPEAKRLIRQLQSTQQQLAGWTLMNPTAVRLTHRAKRLQELNDEKETLESTLSGFSARFRQQSKLNQSNPIDLATELPVDVTLVQLFKADDWERAPGADRWKATPHYEAFVLKSFRSGPASTAREPAVTWIHLGPAQPVEAALASWRRNLQHPDGRGVGGVTSKQPLDATSPPDALRKAIWQKIEPHLAGCKSVIIIPDGDLHFLPWGALPGSKPGTYLIEEYSIATAQDGRQLYQTLTAPALTSEQSLLLVGGVDYDQGDARPTAPPPVIELSANESSDGTRSRPPSLTKRPVWTALAGTAGETEQVTKLAGMRKAKLLRGSEAQENALRQEMPQARFIHLATHGFFADESFRSAFQQDEAGEQLFGGAKNLVTKKQAGVTFRNPLLLSGIVLAGANQPPQIDTLGLETGQDGILTAEEVVNLDLQQTELVVLSACDTGLGRVGGGEGVFGLQRAFALAGARTTIASLWKVDDAATQTLMTEFYRNLWEKKLPKLEALRQAQLTMLHRYDPQTKQLRDPSQAAKPQTKETASKSEALSPFYWSAFTLSGDWR